MSRTSWLRLFVGLAVSAFVFTGCGDFEDSSSSEDGFDTTEEEQQGDDNSSDDKPDDNNNQDDSGDDQSDDSTDDSQDDSNQDDDSTDDSDNSDDSSDDPNNDDSDNQDDNKNDDKTDKPNNCKPTSDGSVAGLVFEDTNGEADSAYAYPSAQNRTPIKDLEVQVQGSGGLSKTTNTCDDGWFNFSSLQNGKYLVTAKEDDSKLFCTTTNDPENLSEAVSEDSINLVTFGDSLPTEGKAPFFPELIKGHLESIGPDVNLTNDAVIGTRSTDWLPDKQLYQDELKPHLKDSDLIVFSIGGNDFYRLRKQVSPPVDVTKAIQLFNDIRQEVINNIETITAKLRKDAPNADIVFVLYPNYAKSEQWEPFVGDQQQLVASFLASGLEKVRADLADEKRLSIVDLLEATKSKDLSSLLDDPLHFNAKGHKLIGKELFFTLGGVIKGNSSVGMRRHIGFKSRSSMSN
jgi:lysophospholipase L1-like esterase